MDSGEQAGTDPYDWPSVEDGGRREAHLHGLHRPLHGEAGLESNEDYEDYIPVCYYLQRLPPRVHLERSVRMRTSMSKVDPNATNDYEPLQYPNDR